MRRPTRSTLRRRPCRPRRPPRVTRSGADSLGELLEFSLIAFTSIFVLVDPVAAIPTFLVMTSDSGGARRRRMALRAAWTCCIVLAIFGVAGSFIFNLFGITLPAFKIAGGIILGLIGL